MILGNHAHHQQRYASGNEIQRFYARLARQYSVYDHTKFQHAIRKAVWDDDRNVWQLTVEDIRSGNTFTDEAEVFINCGGALK